jgi:hypothetical protein
VYTPEEMSKFGIYAMSAYDHPNYRPRTLQGATLDAVYSTDDIAVYKTQAGEVHIGVRGTQPGANLFDVLDSVYNRSTDTPEKPTELEERVKGEIERVRKAYPNQRLSVWGHSHGAQLISMARQEDETATSYAGYIREDSQGNDVTTNVASDNDLVIRGLTRLHTQATDHDTLRHDIPMSQGNAHSIEHYIDDEVLLGYEAKLAHRKAVNRGWVERAKDTVEDAGATVAKAGATLAEVTTAIAFAPEEITVGAAAAATYGIYHQAGDTVTSADKLLAEVRGNWKKWHDASSGE